MIALSPLITSLVMMTIAQAAPVADPAAMGKRGLISSTLCAIFRTCGPPIPSRGTTISDGYVAQGCYQELGLHLFVDYATSSSDMTQEICAAKCQSLRKPWMALEGGNTCFCSSGDNILSLTYQVPDSFCDSACRGNSKENCGGSLAMVAFKNPTLAAGTSTSASASPSASKSASVKASASSSAAAFSSVSASASKSSVAASSFTSSVSASASKSSSTAFSSSASAAASSSRSSTSAAAASSSSAAASTASSVVASSSSSAAVTSVVASSAAASSSTSASATTSSAAPVVVSSSDAASSTSSGPVDAASSSSSVAATSVSASTSAPSAASSSVVASSTSSSAAVDPTAVPSPWVAAPVQVIAEATSGRALTGASLVSDDMTYTMCLDFCSAGGFALAGLEYGRECYCGNYLTNGASTSITATATMNCAGAGSASSAPLCGGPNAITLFEIPSKVTDLPSDLTIGSGSLASGWSAASTPCVQEISSSSGRNLAADGFTADNMTTTVCVAYCDAKGYGYAGVEYGRECYCANSLVSNTASNQCTMPCPGSSQTICGGLNAITLFQNPSLPKVSGPVLPSGWSVPSQAQAQCIQEVSGRALTGTSTSGSDMTVPKCLNFCATQGFQFGAVEYGTECFCGSNLVNGASFSLTSGQCVKPCAGDASTTCGGPDALQIYVNPSLAPKTVASNGFSQAGCIQEVSGRALTGASTTDPAMTVAMCTAFCASGGFTMAGVEYGQECYCGNSLVNGASTSLVSGECKMACAGDSTAICGGPNAINLYTTSS
ncbi:uncharacterized protein I303_100256 [Kwoniella dejecticola CBS 10117]|uniref:WSC domain-containing protein n=1 Tax=Kwoniella dejecticola CBS 10117 TaxID=1296121 RepID=A0A1A6AED8_9TREE|nr:uncharacterized protein I303_00258 [Kwoniella dejecticola CBS 10117]OBR88441.1 hypothetical protein I303_00258 [Kwoniella dejecticola CBS 10117]